MLIDSTIPHSQYLIISFRHYSQYFLRSMLFYYQKESDTPRRIQLFPRSQSLLSTGYIEQKKKAKVSRRLKPKLKLEGAHRYRRQVQILDGFLYSSRARLRAVICRTRKIASSFQLRPHLHYFLLIPKKLRRKISSREFRW